MQAEITTDGQYILARIPYANGAGKDWAKMVPGARWNPEQKVWRYSLTMDTCRTFRKVFGGQLTVLKPLADWARVAIKAGDVLEELRDGTADVKMSRTAEESPFMAAAIEDRKYQASGVGFMTLAGQCILGDEPGLGKGHPHGTKILTPGGWESVENLIPGDSVIGSDGKPCMVTGTYPRGRLSVFRVTMNDGSSVVVDGDHLWSVRNKNNQNADRPFRTMETREIAGLIHQGWRIPLVEPVQFPKRDLPIDPYLLGVWLGDGGKDGSSFCCGDYRVPAEVSKIIPKGCTLKSRGSFPEIYSIISEDGNFNFGNQNPVRMAMKELGLFGMGSHQRFIPEDYLYSSVEDRTALLQGLMDTDGELSEAGMAFSSSSERLANDFRTLVQSLGGVCRRSSRWGKRPIYTYKGERKLGRPGYGISAIGLPDGIIPARAFADRHIPRTKYPVRRIIDTIEQYGKAEVTCISVDADDQLYVTEDFIVTHNTLQTLATLIECDAKEILVSCPRTATRATWEREVRKWAPSIATFVAQGTRAEREKVMGEFSDHSIFAPGMRKMLIINTEMIRAKKTWTCESGLTQGMLWYIKPGSKDGCKGNHKHKSGIEYEWPFIFERTWDAVVVDESHNLLASTSNVQSGNITQGRFGAMQLRKRVRYGGLALPLSGTPSRSKLTKLWGTLNWCRPDVFTSYWTWAATHFGVTEGRYGRVIQPDSKGKPAKVPKPLDDEAWDAMLRPYYLGRTKRLAAPDLPGIQYAGTVHDDHPDMGNYVWIDMDPKQSRAYREMRDLAETRLKGGTLSAIGTLAEITRLRQFAVSHGRMEDEDFKPSLPSEKIDWILQFMLEREGCDGKILIASQFTSIVHLIESELNKAGWRTMTLTGQTSDKARAQLVTSFNDPDSGIHAAVINSRAGGESITLDGDCDEMIIVDPLWTESQEFQLVSRIHRVSRIHQVIIYRLVSTGTTEEWMVSHTEEQRAVIESSKPQARKAMALQAVRWGK